MFNNIFIPRKKIIQNEAWTLNKAVIHFYSQHPTKSWAESAFEVIKQTQNNPIRWQVLSDSERKWLWNLEKCGIEILTNGWIRLSRWNKQAGKKEKIIPQKVKGINSAIRMQEDHILKQYREDINGKTSELSILESIEGITENANQLLTSWNSASEKEKEELQIELASIVLQLENCRNEFKVSTKNQIEKTVSLTDSKERINPGAMAARTVAALGKLNNRFLQLGIIIPFIAMRKELLILEKRRVELAIEKAARTVLRILRHPVFSNGSILKHENKILLESIGRSLFHLNNIRVSPYWEQAEQAKLFLGQAKKFIAMNKFAKVKTALKEALNILESDLSEID